MSSATPSQREIRVFLSSTFRDMEAERNYLIKQVFPKVRAACLARQVGFTEIDLRWGVTEEEAKNGATVEICLKEIDRCRDFPPFFIGFLGERYGWIPRHEELASYWDKRADSSYRAPILDAVKRQISVTELEMELAVLQKGASDKLQEHALFFLRDAKLTDELYQLETGKQPDHHDARFYDPAEGRLETLKQRIRQSPFMGIDGYTTVAEFGDAVEQYLLGQLERNFPESEVPSAFEQSNQAHAAFRYHRLQNFLPREDVRAYVIAALKRRTEKPALGCILLGGPSGQGKSALMADIARHLEQHHPEYKVIDHYVGADANNSLDNWIHRILQTLHPIIQDISGEIPESSKDRAEALNTWLFMAATRQKVRYVLVLDALDQLSDGGQNLDLLKLEVIGANATVVCSAADGTPASESAKNFEIIAVPALTGALKAKLIADTLVRYRKKLPAELANRLAASPQSGSPLYLTLAIEELRLDARHETLEHLVSDILKQPDAQSLFLNHFLLDEDYGRPELPTLAAAFMALLGASRNGLSESELADLLAMPGDPISEETGKPRLPQIHLSRLLTNFQPFLLNKGGNRAPMHRIFGEAALDYYDTNKVREHLYHHFKGGYGASFEDANFNVREAAEALYQITWLAQTNYEQQIPARMQLIQDLGLLHVPATLHKKAEELVLDSLTLLEDSESDKQTLSDLWQAQIMRLDAQSLQGVSESITDLAGWQQEIAYDRYRLPRRLMEHLLSRQESQLDDENTHLAASMNMLGWLCSEMADFAPVRRLNERALAIREKSLGADHPDVAESLNNLAAFLDNTGDPVDLAAARPLYERALAIQEKSHGPDHPMVATYLNNLAVYLTNTGDPVDRTAARSLHERALAIREKSLGADHPAVAGSLNNLAAFLDNTGDPVDLAAARPLYERALAIQEKSHGPDHPMVATYLNNLAVYLTNTGDPVDRTAARSLYERALAIMEKSHGADHPDVAASLNYLARYLENTGDSVDFAAARPLYERALAIQEKSHGLDHPDVATCLNNLSGYLKNTGVPVDFAAAQPLYERALAIFEKSFGADHLNVATALNNLAGYLINTGDPVDKAAARSLYERALDIREKSLGVGHPDVASSINDMAGYLQHTGAQDDLAAARSLFERALAIREKSLGAEHIEVGVSLSNLAYYLENTGSPDDFAAAVPLYERAIAIYERLGPPRCRELLGCVDSLAFHYYDAGKLSSAAPYFQRSLEIREHMFEKSHPEIENGLDNLASLFEELGKLEFAIPLRIRQLELLDEKLGIYHEKTLNLLQNTARELRDAARINEAEKMQREAVRRLMMVHGENSLQVATGYSSLGIILTKKKSVKEAKQCYLKALRIRECELGMDAEPTKLVRNRLDELRKV